MKPLRILLFSFLLALFIAPVATAQNADVKFGATEFYRSYTKSHTADTIRGAVTKSKSFYIGKSYDYNYLCQVHCDSLTRNGTQLIVLYGSVNGTDTYALDTVTWSVSSADTTVLFQSTSAVRWPYLLPALKGNSATDRGRLGDIFMSISSSSQ